ncbi:MAG: DUF1540 domain-containing protein [Clostridium sp.]
MKGILNCTALDCVNNTSAICSAITINVSVPDDKKSELTRCETFAHKGLKNSIANVLNINVVGEFKQVFNHESIVMNPRIRCEATRCIHNEEEICRAKNIFIEDIGDEKGVIPQCDTFEE